MGIREENLQTIFMQYSGLKDTINEQYIIRQNDDENEAVED